MVPFQQLEGKAKSSFVSASLVNCDESSKKYADQVLAIQDTASTVYAGMTLCRLWLMLYTNQILSAAADTIVSSILTFILAMLKYPEVQRRAQEEVDSVVGHERLPDLSDIEQLPYVSAVMKEALR